jgi:hypothetical protein
MPSTSTSGQSRTARHRLLLAGVSALMAVVVVVPMAATASGAVTAADEAGPTRRDSAERLALRLLNCTRTGGWVKPDGTCKGRDSGRYSAKMPALRLHDGISDRVAFPWSAELVQARVCAHNIDGLPEVGHRFAQAGFSYQYFGENIGCAWGGMSVRDMVVRSHVAMQAEKRTGGGHWRNMKNRGYRSVGIGVATLDGWATIVYDFYGR